MEGEDIQALVAKAAKARYHARRLNDQSAARALVRYAEELEAQAEALRKERSQPVDTLPEAAADAPTGEPAIGPELIAAMKPPVPPEEET
jgi:hypothetical protein